MSDTPAAPAPSANPEPAVGAVCSWRFRADFAPWLREQRRIHRLTLKGAAERLGVTYTRLHKLETGGRVRAPTLELLGRVAEVYGYELAEVLARAGYRMELPWDLRDGMRCDDAFAAIVMHPALRPAAMDERWLEAYSRLQKAQWVEFARKLEAHVRGGGPSLREIMDDGGAANDQEPVEKARQAS